MSDYLPPLTALRAFDAAARHLSFARAADELAVTPAALSFQIKSLEEHLGVPVFRRLNRAVELTEAGRLLAPGAEEGFSTLTRAWRSARRLVDDTTLTVTAGPAFTSKWLAPRLFRFAEAHPEIELRFSASLRLMDFDRDEIDIAIRFGPDRQEQGLYSEIILQEWVIPVMTPDMARRYGTPKLLREAPLIHDDSLSGISNGPDWAAWLKTAGVDRSGLTGPRFSQADHAIDLALEGGGVALGRLSVIERALASGALVAPFGPALMSGGVYRLLCPKGHEERPVIAAFRAWVLSEMSHAHALTDQFHPA